MHLINLLAVLGLWSTVTGATEVVGHNATIEQCKDNMNGKLPNYYPTNFHFSGNVRRYYIAAEIEEWDYTPSGWDNWLSVPADESFRMQNLGFVHNDKKVGHKYDKAVYREYTDPTFTQRVEQPDWLGVQGPVIRAEVGDMIEVLFTNKMQNYRANIHSMGLFYSVENRGGLYYNMTPSCSPGDDVPKDACFVYKWLVTDDLGPAEGEPSRLLGYHGFISMPEDTNSGLFGSNIIYRRGQMNETMQQNREYVVVFAHMDERESMLTAHNVEKYLPEYYKEMKTAADDPHTFPGMNYTYWHPQAMNKPATKGLKNACGMFYTLNGFSYSNNPPFETCVDDPVIWYIYNIGDSPHAVHWHGNNVLRNGMKVPTIGTHPGEYHTVHMNAVNPGVWQLLCHYYAHKDAGMDGLYRVWPRKQCPLKPLATNDMKRQSS